MKKNYQQPTMLVVKVQQPQVICQSVTSVYSGDTNIKYYGSGSAESARVKTNSVDWDEWEE